MMPLPSTTPATISDTIKRYCAKTSSQALRWVRVIPEEGAKSGWCIVNVMALVDVQGGAAQNGWIVWENPHWIQLEYHTIWIAPDGKWVDITPKADGEKRILFLPDKDRWSAPPYSIIPNKHHAKTHYGLQALRLSGHNVTT